MRLAPLRVRSATHVAIVPVLLPFSLQGLESSKLAALITRAAADEITKLKAAGGELATQPTSFFRTLFQSSTLAHSQSAFPPLDTLTRLRHG
jgi:hypothetical protein